ncbi:UDP-glycosyltransferase 74F2 [Morus notabilis]|uniref:Glycosyltransferase n=1 Tax=Morus notabilis TaxID=981085 RepID=W9R7H8_9ROSA|nr:UDP-glycosyltransferase 74F1 [Morus notabilis]EXB61153.1 UDP-glycosyltransferase 74F2 [Morus notabilis]
MAEKEMETSSHCLVLSYPTQGHINPLLQFCKRLRHKGLHVTLVTAKSMLKNLHVTAASLISIDTISDGYDDGGLRQAGSTDAYLDRFWRVGPATLAQLIKKLSGAGRPVDCVVYDSFLPWALDVAKEFGLVGAVFFTQSCTVDCIYYHVHRGLLRVPVSESGISIPGCPPFRPSDLPSFVYDTVSHQAVIKMVVDQFSNVEKADWVLCNTYYELEEEVANWMMKILPLRTIGPTIPSMYLDKRLEGDDQYGFSLFPSQSEACLKWLNSRPKGSVAYLSFGSLVDVEAEQIEELANGLKRSNCHFLWVVRASEADKLPKGFVDDTSDRGLVVSWCPQLEVLANDAVGCFVTHCGWNSTLEALSLGVPMVAMPQWSDQFTNAKYIVDVWKVGLKAPTADKGIARGEAVENCVKEIIGERGKEMKRNAIKWSSLAKKAVNEGGSSDKNIDEFIAKLGH